MTIGGPAVVAAAAPPRAASVARGSRRRFSPGHTPRPPWARPPASARPSPVMTPLGAPAESLGASVAPPRPGPPPRRPACQVGVAPVSALRAGLP
eukprot:6269626-Prymnesium_polylepis.2